MLFPWQPSPRPTGPVPTRPRRLPLAAPLLAAGLLLAASSVPAASLYQDGAGARSAAMGGTGTAAANDPLGTLFNNPAAMSEVDRLSAGFGLDAGFAHGSFYNRANRHSTMWSAGVLGEGAITVPVGPVRFGLGFNPDIAAQTDWRYRDAPGGADGATTYGVRDNQSTILLLRSAIGASWQVTPTLSLGGSLGALYNENHLQTPYVFQTQPTLRTVKTLLDLRTDGWGWNGQAALRWRPVSTVALSATYTSRACIESDGTARGNARTQLANLGLGAARPDFFYDAEVDNAFPQQVSAGVSWEATRRLTLSAQFDWINWSDAFDTLPVRLTRGNNADLNGLVGSSRLHDDIPLRWRDQYVGRVGVEQRLGDHWALRAGYAYGNNPVPAETLSPLTAAITEHTLTAGVGYRWSRLSLDAAYQWQLPATGRVRRSGLAAGEYSGSVTEVDVQRLSLTTSISF